MSVANLLGWLLVANGVMAVILLCCFTSLERRIDRVIRLLEIGNEARELLDDRLASIDVSVTQIENCAEQVRRKPDYDFP